jgi:hypothetical protein
MKTILPAQKRFVTVPMLIALPQQKLAPRAQTVCDAGAPSLKEPFMQMRLKRALQNRFNALLEER